MSHGVKHRGAQEEISIIPARGFRDDFVKKGMFRVVLEVWVGFLGGARRKGAGEERQRTNVSTGVGEELQSWFRKLVRQEGAVNSK